MNRPEYDPALAEAEERRREELARNGAYQRGVAHAKVEALRNTRGALQAELDSLKRSTVTRDANLQSRDNYNRTYNRVVAAAERLALATGQPVSGIPAWLAPPVLVAENSVTIAVPKPANALLNPLGKVAKPTGMGVDGKGTGCVPGFPGTDASEAWLSVQGAQK